MPAIRQARLLAVLLLPCFVPTGIGAAAGPDASTAKMQSSSPDSSSRVVVDEMGRIVTVPKDLRRIVSLAPSVTEMIYALNLDDRLAGDTDYCDVPPAAKLKPHVGSFLNPSLESIIALHPDVVIAVAYSGNREETADALQKLGVAVYVINPQTVPRILDSMSGIAKLAGDDKRGAEVVSALKSRLDVLQKRLADLPLVHVLFVVQLEPLITAGQHTFIADALRWAGAESIVVSKVDWPKLSMEEVVRLQPDYIVVAPGPMTDSVSTVTDLRKRVVWRDLLAVQAGHVAIVSEEIDRPAPGLIDAIEQLAHEIHPTAFSMNAGEDQYPRLRLGSLSEKCNSARWQACAH